MIDKIKRAIAEYHGEREWFFVLLKTGGWQHYPGVRYKHDEWRIQLDNGIQIDITDLNGGRYRVATGVPGRYAPIMVQWDDVEFAQSSELDTDWKDKVFLVLNRAYTHPNILESLTKTV